MRYRKLRIAFSVFCGIACALLVVLWARTRFASETVSFPISNTTQMAGTSRQGAVGIGLFCNARVSPWQVDTHPADSTSDYQYPTAMGFAAYRSMDHNLYIVRLPYWSLILIFSALGAVPWVRCQFSLRTLLIATTLVAVVLGLIVWQVRQ
jgi:hypothetical protein